MRTLTLKRTVPMAALVLILAGCGSKINQENFNRVLEGMSENDVINILGEPTESQSLGVGPLSGTNATWRKDHSEITIQFLNGKVALKNFAKG